MLLAEIHGKRCVAARNSEDYLTSAVFGHLRQVQDWRFWKAVFQRSQAALDPDHSLWSLAVSDAVHLEQGLRISILFWPNLNGSEPDLLVRLDPSAGRSMLVLIEVKLTSGKSSHGEDDQLKRYFELLRDESAIGSFAAGDPSVALLYLTEKFSMHELRQSVRLTGRDARHRMFAMQWQDLLQAAEEMHEPEDSLIGEVIRFLKSWGLERFAGFGAQPPEPPISGSFYRSEYMRFQLNTFAFEGNFYANS